jgi:hypothetical protein
MDKINADDYRKRKAEILRSIENVRPSMNLHEAISLASACAGVHILCSYQYYAEENGFEEIQEDFDRLKEFYRLEVV